MTKPWKYVIRMLVFLGLVLLMVSALARPVSESFVSSPFLNGVIIVVYIFATVLCFRQVLHLNFEVDWLNDFLSPTPGFSSATMPELLSPAARLLREHQYENGGRPYLSTQAMNSLLDIIYDRLQEQREMNRYFVNILLSLGLLGTFWGLVITLSSISGIIGDLSISSDNLVVAFDELKKNLQAPIGGMSTAFSTSLFGLFCSITLGFLDLQATSAHGAFYNQLEEKLSGLTRLSEEGREASFADLKTTLNNIQSGMIRSEEHLADVLEHQQPRWKRSSDPAAKTSLLNAPSVASSGSKAGKKRSLKKKG